MRQERLVFRRKHDGSLTEDVIVSVDQWRCRGKDAVRRSLTIERETSNTKVRIKDLASKSFEGFV